MHTCRDVIELCQTAKADNRNAVLCKLELANGKAPTRIPLFPAPGAAGVIKARDKRVFRMNGAANVVASFNADEHDIPLDWEHASELKAPNGEKAPAAGWITKLALESNGAIYGEVEWTAAGQQSVESREYRYISPAFRLHPDTREVLQLVSAGLTNTPALTMPALTSVQNGDNMNPKILKLLGLSEDATAEQIEAAITAYEAKNASEVEAKTALEATRAKLETELAAARSSQQDLKQFVPRADYDATLARVVVLEKKAEDEKAAAHKAQVDSAIEQASKDGKITPASKAFYTKVCATAEGLADFRAFCSSAPVIAPDDVVEGRKPPTSNDGSLTELDFQAAERCGVTREQLIASVKTAS